MVSALPSRDSSRPSRNKRFGSLWIHASCRSLDAIFGGELDGEDLRRVALTLVDFDVLLQELAGRRTILALIPDEKRAELEAYVGRDISPSAAAGWNGAEVRRIQDFFGLVEERLAVATPTAVSNIHPSTGCLITSVSQSKACSLSWSRTTAEQSFTCPRASEDPHCHACGRKDSKDNEPSIVVWLASGRELLEQATTAFEEAWMHLRN